MPIDYNNIEKLYLREEEIEYIKYIIVNPKIGSEETKKWIAWYLELSSNVVINKTSDPKEIEQYERIREIDFLFKILQGSYCQNILELFDNDQIMDEMEKHFQLGVMVEDNAIKMEEYGEQKIIEKLMEEEYEQDLEEPYIQELIQELLKDSEKAQKFIKLDRLIKAAEFKHIDDKVMLSISYLMLKEFKKAEKEPRLPMLLRTGVEKKAFIFFLIKNMKYAPINIDDKNTKKKK